MTSKQPRLCAGINVIGDCTISILVGASALTVTIGEGTYWVDPVYNGLTASDVLGALEIFSKLIDAADTGGTYTPSWASTTDNTNKMNEWQGTITRSAATFSIRGANAATTTEGKRFLRFLGFDFLKDSTAAIDQATPRSGAIWDPLRGENQSPEDVPTSSSVVVRTGGYAYSFDTGDQLLSRVVSFPALNAPACKRRGDSVVAASSRQCDFESTMWPWLYTGSPVRYWQDKNATQNTYLAAAMTAIATSLTLPSNFLGANDSMICVDGEWMVAHSGSGTTTVTVIRDQPVAHSKYAPVSTDTVATYVLGDSGGNIDIQGFNPKRRSEEIDRWDFQLALDRTQGV